MVWKKPSIVLLPSICIITTDRLKIILHHWSILDEFFGDTSDIAAILLQTIGCHNFFEISFKVNLDSASIVFNIIVFTRLVISDLPPTYYGLVFIITSIDDVTMYQMAAIAYTKNIAFGK